MQQPHHSMQFFQKVHKLIIFYLYSLYKLHQYKNLKRFSRIMFSNNLKLKIVSQDILARSCVSIKQIFKGRVKTILMSLVMILIILLFPLTQSFIIESYEYSTMEMPHYGEETVQFEEFQEGDNVRKLETKVTQIGPVKDTIEQKAVNVVQNQTQNVSSNKNNDKSDPSTIKKSNKKSLSNLYNSILINIKYPEKDYLPLPVDFMRKDKHQKGIADVLYKTDDIRQKRKEYHKQRISFIDKYPNLNQLYLAKYNIVFDEQSNKTGQEANIKEWDRLNKKYRIEDISQQLSMCIVVVGYNNNANSRIQYNLNSIFTQNYTNFKAIIIDDASNDGSSDIYRKYFAFHRIDKKYYYYIQNRRRVTALQNIYFASMNLCGRDSIVVTLDADDEFIGRNVLQVFNWGYQTKKTGVLYANFYWYEQSVYSLQGLTREYTELQKQNNLYRNVVMKFSQLRSYRNELLYQVDIKALQDENGNFFTITYDQALFFPLMELSCGRISKIDDYYPYLQNQGTSLNDYKEIKRQVAVQMQIRTLKKHKCYKTFDQKMNK